VAEFSIEAQERTIVGKKVKNLRKAGLVPIAIYGPKVDPMKLQVPYRPLEVALMKAGGTNLIDILIGKEKHVVLARDVQRDSIKRTILHADFFVVDMKTKIRAEIPVVLINESPPVEAREGILLTGTNTITVETLPDKLQNQFEIDLSLLLEIGDTITIADLDLGEGIVIINEPDEFIAGVRQTSAARSEELEGALLEGEEGEVESGSEPEVITKGKEEEEE